MDLESSENYIGNANDGNARPRRNCVINFSALGLRQLNILFGEGRIKFRIVFLKMLKLSEFLRSGADC